MGVKKDIGKTYNDKLKDINIAPDDKVWEKIQSTLDNKKKNKAFPFWARTIGIGLLLLLIGGYGYNSFFNNSSNNTPINQTEENLNKEQNDNSNNDLLITDTNESDEKLEKVYEEQNSSIINNSKKLESSDVLNNNNNISTSENINNNSDANSELKNNISSKNNLKQISSQNLDNENNSKFDNKNISVKNSNKKTGNISELNKSTNNNNLNYIDSNTGNKKLNSTENNNQIASSNDTDRNTKSIITNQNNIVNLKNKEELIDSIAKLKKIVSDSIIKKDSLLLAKQIDSTVTKKKLEEPKSEWEVGIYIIPTYFGSITKGSSLGETLTENDKQANLTLNYRVLANFKLSNRLTLRTGFGSTKLSTTTLKATLTNASGMMANLSSFSNLSYDFVKLNEVETNNSLGSNTDINFKEELTFFELPIEVVYKFEPKNKLTWKAFSGISTYKISNNRVYAESSNGSYEIGQINNLKQYSFSFNLGGGLDYKINDKINLTAEPIVRYHINMYKRKVFNYNPISTGLSVGLSYKF